ncbi:MAG: hypothetical protein IPP47_06670 [Bryobacterales bacterium]|nr:hypothetical protein [Bryobacterales bacterium]
MSDPNKKNEELTEYAGGWMTERKGTEVPGFLKLAFPVIGLGATSYFILYMNGEVSHDERGPLVRLFNQATTSADGLMYVVAAMALVFVVTVILFSIRKSKHEE